MLQRINYEYANATGVDPSVVGWQCADNTSSAGATRGTLSADSSTFDSGSHSGLIVNPPTDPNASYGRSACEVLTGHTAKTGQDIYYALAVRFPTNWATYGHSNYTSRASVAQVEYVASGAGGIAVEAYTDRVALSASTGNCVTGVGCDYDNSCGGECWGHANNVQCSPATGTNPFGGLNGCKIIPAGQLQYGIWNQIVIHIHETPNTDGVIEAWWKRKGETTWNKTVTMTGMPTMVMGANSFGQVFDATTYNNGLGVTDKFGLQDRDLSLTESIGQDDDCVATSFAAAVGCFNGA